MVDHSIDQYLQAISSLPFQWGCNDCYTLVYDLLFIRFPGNQLPNFKCTYSTRKEALNISKTHSWIRYLKQNFNIQIKSCSPTQNDHDLLLIHHNQLQCIHYIYRNKLFSIQENYKLIQIPIKFLSLTDINHQIIQIKSININS